MEKETAITNLKEMKPTQFELSIDPTHPKIACDALSVHSGLSKSRIKQAMNKGAVWHRGAKTKLRRLRKATAVVKPGDRLVLYYDPSILSVLPPEAHCHLDMTHYSIWYKPPGLMTQGTRYGDHCALSRQVERHYGMKRGVWVWVVHRIDREAGGLVVVAHSRTAAAKLSALFRNNQVHKEYSIWVLGDLAATGKEGRIDADLDSRRAVTDYRCLRHDRNRDQTLVHVQIRTGRLHQIRRHFARIGFPVMGDPRYGQGNECSEGLQLTAFRIALECPFGKGRIDVAIDPEGFDE